MNFANIALLAEETAPQQQGGMPSWVIWVILGVAFVLMIAMTIIPRRKQQKQTENMMSSLKVGDTVMTIGRIVGEIIAIDNAKNTVTIKSGVGDNASTLVIDKLAVGMVINPNMPVSQTKEEKKEEEKEKAPVIEKIAKENKIASVIKQQKKGGAFEELDNNDEAKAEEVKPDEVKAEEVKTEEVVAEPVVEEVKEEVKEK